MPPIAKVVKKAMTHNMGEARTICPLYIVKSQLNIFTPVGTAIIIVAIPFIALGFRYIMVMIFALMFPIMIFLYFFDFTKKLGSKLFRTSMLWVAVPIVQSIFIAVMIKGMTEALKASIMGGRKLRRTSV